MPSILGSSFADSASHAWRKISMDSHPPATRFCTFDMVVLFEKHKFVFVARRVRLSFGHGEVRTSRVPLRCASWATVHVLLVQHCCSCNDRVNINRRHDETFLSRLFAAKWVYHEVHVMSVVFEVIRRDPAQLFMF